MDYDKELKKAREDMRKLNLPKKFEDYGNSIAENMVAVAKQRDEARAEVERLQEKIQTQSASRKAFLDECIQDAREWIQALNAISDQRDEALTRLAEAESEKDKALLKVSELEGSLMAQEMVTEEKRELLDKLGAEIGESGINADSSLWARLLRERDEARAESERLRERLQAYKELCDAVGKDECSVTYCGMQRGGLVHLAWEKCLTLGGAPQPESEEA